MARILVQDDAVTIQLSALDKVWAVHGSLRVPLSDIMQAHVEDEVGWDHFWRRIMGMNAPGLKMAGTFFIDGGLAFLDYGTGRNCLVLDTKHLLYRKIIVEPDGDAATIAAQINSRLKG